MGMKRNVFGGVIGALLTVAPASGQRAVLRPIATLTLDGPADVPLAQPVGLSIDDTGRILVIDGRVPRGLLYQPDGRYVLTLGTKGNGPGEFTDAFLGVPFPNGQFGIVADARPPGLFLFDGTSGKFVRKLTLTLASLPTAALLDGNRTLLLGSISFANRASILRVDLETGRESWIGPLPDVFQPGGPIAGIFHGVYPVKLSPDRLLIGYEPLGELLDVRISSGQHSTVSIPVERRRGQPDDLAKRLRDAMRASYGHVFAQTSDLRFAVSVGPLQVLVVYADLTSDMPPVPGAAYMTVLDLGSRRACVDVPVPMERETLPVFTWHDGKLGILQQVIVGTEAQTRLTWYGLDLSACRWSELR